MFLTTGAISQKVENDDMYFTASDRAKLRSTRQSERLLVAKTVEKDAEEVEAVNPTDSYSAREVNPEYTSRLNTEAAQSDNEDYFVNNYQVVRQNQLNNWHNNYNSWYSNAWYTPAYFAPGINRWNSPYYGGYYDGFGSPWANPYYGSGWSSSFSYHWGNSYNYGWNNGWGMAFGNGCPMNYWNSPWYSPAYASWYSPFNYSPWSPYGYGYGYGYPAVVVVENGRSNQVYGKRPTRGTNIVTSNADTRGRNGTITRTNSNNSGRSATNRQDPYYNRTWRNSADQQQVIYQPQNSRPAATQNRSRTWGNDNSSNSSWGNPSPSRSSMSTGSPTRSQSTSPGSGSNGRTRGRD